MAGLDAIILTGRSPQPVWIWIRDGQAEIRDAARALGPGSADRPGGHPRGDRARRTRRVLQIGRAGENLVPYAMLMNDLRHYNGRTGMGAVMGSKNLRAIAVKGSSRYLELAHDPAALGKLGKGLAERVTEHPQSLGPPHQGDARPDRRPQRRRASCPPATSAWVVREVEGIGFAAFEAIRSGTRTCYACAVRCKPETAFEGRYRVTDTYDGPEYEAIAGFGSNCAIFDIQLVAQGQRAVQRGGHRRHLGRRDRRLRHGVRGARPARRRARPGRPRPALRQRRGGARGDPAHRGPAGAGELLALGSRAIAARVGGGSEAWAMQVKGLELAMHEPRGKVGVALGYATNEAGRGPPRRLPRPDLREPGVRGLQGRDAAGHHRAVPARGPWAR